MTPRRPGGLQVTGATGAELFVQDHEPSVPARVATLIATDTGVVLLILTPLLNKWMHDRA